MNDLSGGDGLVVTLNKFVTFGKATFSEELSFYVLPIRHLTVRVLHSLLNYLGRLLVGP